MTDPPVWMYLMVGGPWHGALKPIPQRIIERVGDAFGMIDVPDPRKPYVYERAEDFGSPVEFALIHTTLYRLVRYYMTDRDGDETHIQCLVVCGLHRRESAQLMNDALEVLRGKLWREGYR